MRLGGCIRSCSFFMQEDKEELLSRMLPFTGLVFTCHLHVVAALQAGPILGLRLELDRIHKYIEVKIRMYLRKLHFSREICCSLAKTS